MKDFKKSVVYQIYPKSFKDSNGDGIGDLGGIIEKLDYLKTLGIDYIWMTPIYLSPQMDNGYDVEDYCVIDPSFGTIEDFKTLVDESKKRDIDIMIDMVLNHSSTEHIWFKKALAGDEKYKNYYIFKKDKNGEEPTNWVSKFGGSAWKYVEHMGEYYLHLFDETQGDLNWENKELREEIYKIVNFWIELGVKGFRLDVINLISKPKEFINDENGDGRVYYTDGPKIHEYLKELTERTFSKNKDIVTVGEMSSTTLENCIKYSNPQENELSMVFNFHHLKVDYKDGEKWTLVDFDFKELKKILSYWQEGMEAGNGWSAVFWCNHDQPRINSRFGSDDKYRKESSKMLGTTVHMMRGTPYIYQGEELGMTNPYFGTIDKYRDIESINAYDMLKRQGVSDDEIIKILQSKSRDNSRTPMQWTEEENAGFTKGSPWIEIADNYKSINVKEAMEDEDSVFYHYKKLIALRKELDIIAYGSFKMILQDSNDILAYIREYNNEKLVVINNFYGKDVNFKLPDEIQVRGEVRLILSNYKDSKLNFENIILRPYESLVYLIKS